MPARYQSVRATQALLDHFDRVEPACHACAERCLYPALIETLGATGGRFARQLADDLAREHRALQAMWKTLRQQLVATVAGQPADSIVSRADEFIRSTRLHLESEERNPTRSPPTMRCATAVLSPTATTCGRQCFVMLT